MGEVVTSNKAESEVEIYNTTGDYYGDRISIVEGGAVRLHTAKRVVTLPSIAAWVDMYLKIAALEAELAALKGRATQGNRELAEQFVLWSGGSISLHYDTMREAESKIATHAASRLAPAQAELETARDCIEWILPLAKGYVAKNDVGVNRRLIKGAEDFLRHQRDNAQGEG